MYNLFSKGEKYRVQLAIKGNLITQAEIILTPIIILKTIKYHLDSVLYNDSRYVNINIKDFYLTLNLNGYEYIYNSISLSSQKFCR